MSSIILNIKIKRFHFPPSVITSSEHVIRGRSSHAVLHTAVSQDACYVGRCGEESVERSVQGVAV